MKTIHQLKFFSDLSEFMSKAQESEENVLRERIAHDLLLRKIQKEKWTVEPEIIKKWFQKANERMSHYRSVNILTFQLDETIHYLTFDQLMSCTVPHKAENAYVVDLFKQLTSDEKLSPIGKIYKDKLQKPADTFGEQVVGALCKKCRRSEAAFFALQTRSADEPTSYYWQCKDSKCNHRWKDR